MPINGTYLLQNLLAATAGNPQPNDNPAAGGYMITPDQQLDEFNKYHGTSYKSIGDAKTDTDADDDVFAAAGSLKESPIYYDRTGKPLPEGTVKSPQDLQPMKSPSFYQRFANPQMSDEAQRLNSSFITSPEMSALANRTQLGIAANNIRSGLRTAGVNPLYADPNDLAAATGGISDIGALNRAYGQGWDIVNSVPLAESNARQAIAQTVPPTAESTERTARSGNLQGVPELRTSTDISGLQASGLANKEFINEAPLREPVQEASLVNQLTSQMGIVPSEQLLNKLQTLGKIASQGFRNEAERDEAIKEAGLTATELAQLPELERALSNKITAEKYQSGYTTPVQGITGKVIPGTEGIPGRVEKVNAGGMVPPALLKAMEEDASIRPWLEKQGYNFGGFTSPNKSGTTSLPNLLK